MKLQGMAIVLSLLTFTAFSEAQVHKKFTLEELVPGGDSYHRYQPEDLDGLQWWGDLCVYCEDTDTLRIYDPREDTTTVLFTFEQLHRFLSEKGLNLVYRPDRLSFPEPGKTEVLIDIPGKGYARVNFKEWNLLSFIPVPSGGEHSDVSPTSEAVAFTVGNHLYISTPDGERQITSAPDGVVCGQCVHREEFGIRKGTFWSPDGHRLAYYRMDERMVTEYPLVNYDTCCAEAAFIRYPMAGMTSHEVTVDIYNVAEDTTVFLETGDPKDRYFTNISWSPDSEEIYLIELNRDQNHSQLVRYDASTGQRKGIIYEECHPKYVHPMHPVLFLPWNPTQFILQSERDGYNHIYLYDISGKLVKQLMEGSWVVQKVLGFDASTQEVILNSNERSPLRSTIFRVHTGTGKRTLFGSDEKGWHQGLLSSSGRYLADTYQAPHLPRKVGVIDDLHHKEKVILEAENPYIGTAFPQIEVGTLKAADEVTDLFYRLVKPTDFTPEKKYPVLIYVYGGPGIRLITDQWLHGTRGWDLYMAQCGYLVFTVDNRGSSERGFEFESCTFRQLGLEEGKDQMKGVEFLRSLPYVDSDRIGVHGWSYGGYMTTSLMLRYPEVFKAGVAGGSVIDWKYYEIMYGERYMDTPQANPGGYEACDLIRLAGNLRGHLLLIQDTNDPVVIPQHTLSFLKACVEARTYPDYFEYPGHAHNVLGRDRVHLFEKITRYFDTHLK